MPSARIQEMFSEGVGRNREPSQRQLELEALLPESVSYTHLDVYKRQMEDEGVSAL